jgi:hypothetical protein
MLKTVVVFQTVVVGSVSVLLALMSQPSARAQVTASVANAEVAKTDALANVLQALKEAQYKIDCTFALKMMEVDPNVDSRIRVGAPDGGRARIRRILPPACLK